jgi:hypothetical protein
MFLMMEGISTSKMSVNFYQTTWRYIPEDSHLHTRRRENLKSHKARLQNRGFFVHPIYMNVTNEVYTQY